MVHKGTFPKPKIKYEMHRNVLPQRLCKQLGNGIDATRENISHTGHVPYHLYFTCVFLSM